MAITKIKAKNNRDNKQPKPIRLKLTKESKLDKAKVSKTTKSKELKVTKEPKNKIVKIILKIGGYFKGSWQELKQVRWPNRRAAWALTGAVLLFTGFFVVLIIFLDYIFQLLFKLIIK